VSEFDLPPLDPELRALLDRTKGTQPDPAPPGVRERVMARLDGVLYPSGIRLAHAARWVGASLRARRVAPWIVAGALAAGLALHMGRRGWDRRQIRPDRTGLVGLVAPSMRADRPETLVPSLACDSRTSLDSNPDHCGRCGHDCCGGTCEHGVCQPFVIAQGYHPGRPAVDATSLYWPDGNDTLGRIMKVPRRGGEAVALASNQRHPWAVAVDGTHVYWTTNSDAAPAYGGVFKVPVGGGEVVALVPSGEAFAGDILVDGSHVYWEDYGEYTPAAHSTATDPCAPGARIRRADLDGSRLITLASPDVGVCTPLFMAVDSTHVYWPSRFAHTIQRVGLDGKRPETIASSPDPGGVAIDASYVYWTNWKDGTVQRAPLEGGPAATIASSGNEVGPNGGVGAGGLAVDTTHVIWLREGPPWGAGGAILVTPTEGMHGDVGAVLATSPSPAYLASDSACVYWSDGADGKIRGIAKP
jgi:hypothetical protein